MSTCESKAQKQLQPLNLTSELANIRQPDLFNKAGQNSEL